MAVMSVLSANSSPLVNLTGMIVSPFRAGYTAIATWFNDLQNYYKDTTDLQAENAALRQQIAKNEETIREAEAAVEENKRLHELLKLTQKRRDLSDLEAAMVTEHEVTNWTSSLTLNKGTSHGVEKGDCVVTEAGYLVGVVTEAGYNWSTVRTILDSETSIGALVFRTGGTAVAQGSFDLMGEGRLALDYLGSEPDVVAGDLIVTSGLAGYYPSQLVIGYVQEVRASDNGLAQYAVIAPQADLSALTQVFVVTDFDVVD